MGKAKNVARKQRKERKNRAKKVRSAALFERRVFLGCCMLRHGLAAASL